MLEPISISMQSLNLPSLLPMAIIILGALAIICLDLASKSLKKSFYTMIGLLFILLDLGAVIGYQGDIRGFFDVILVDGIANLGQIIILVASAFFLPLALSQQRFQEFAMAEFYALFLFMIAGFQFMVVSDNLILIFIGLETSSLALYTMIAMHNRKKSFEAAIKYFTMGALAAGFYTLSALIFYALSGSVEIHTILANLSLDNSLSIVGVLAASIFMLGALGFKLSLVPFHTWTPDVYEGSSSAMAGYMSIVPKIAAFIVAMRLYEGLLVLKIDWLEGILYGLIVITITFGNITALVQDDVKRMLAYSSIAHAGFVMAALVVGTTQANAALFLYWILFMFTNLGAFTILWATGHKKNLWDKRYEYPFSKFAGLIKVRPMMAVTMAFFMFGLAGIPPLSVFWGKLYLLSSVVNAGYIGLAIIMVINSAIAVYYYMKLVVYMFLLEPVSDDGSLYMINITNTLKTIFVIAVMITIFSVLLIEPLTDFILSEVSMSGF